MKFKVYTTAAALLTALAKYYEKHADRWVQGIYVARKLTKKELKRRDLFGGGELDGVEYCDPRGTCFCLVGGINHLGCKSRDDIVDDAMDRVRATIRSKPYSRSNGIEDWNDAKGRTVDQIITTVRKAAGNAA